MKTFNQFNRLLFSLFCLIAITSCQMDKDPVVITLTVDVSELGGERDNPGGCALSAEPASVIIDNSSPKNFTVEVEKGTEILWQGTTDQGGKVNITRISYERGTNIFRRINLNGVEMGGRDKVKGKTRKKTPENSLYGYSIHFTVPGKGSFNLDPKIKVN